MKRFIYTHVNKLLFKAFSSFYILLNNAYLCLYLKNHSRKRLYFSGYIKRESEKCCVCVSGVRSDVRRLKLCSIQNNSRGSLNSFWSFSWTRTQDHRRPIGIKHSSAQPRIPQHLQHTEALCERNSPSKARNKGKEDIIYFYTTTDENFSSRQSFIYFDALTFCFKNVNLFVQLNEKPAFNSMYSLKTAVQTQLLSF